MNYTMLHKDLVAMPLSALRRVSLYGLIHALVDASSALAVLRAGGDLHLHLDPFSLIVLYDILAFGLQAPLGALFDRWHAYRLATLMGLTLTGAALVFARVSPFMCALTVGVGNALFHLGAGATVLTESRGRAADAGVFVAPGAVGLALGMWLGKTRSPIYWPFAMALGVSLLVVAALSRSGVLSDTSTAMAGAESRQATAAPQRALMAMVMLLLLASVFVRSFVGFGTCYLCPREPLLLLGLPAMACVGKLVGGYVADRMGWVATGVGVLLVSAPFVAFNGGAIGPALLGVALFQMTMPVTLAATYRLLPRRPALAFGLPCFALLIGALPTFYPTGKVLYSSGVFLTLITASALALWLALLRLGQTRSWVDSST